MADEVQAQTAQTNPVSTSTEPSSNAAAAVAISEASPAAAALPPMETTVTPAAEVKAAESILGAQSEAAPEAPKTETKDKAPEAKPEEKTADAKVEEPKKEEASQSEDPAPLPTYDAFALPDDIKLDDAKLGEFTKELAEFETLTKADHAEVQKFAQKLVDRHIADTRETLKRYQDAYTAAHEKQKSDWIESVTKDPEIGGNRIETTKKQVSEFINTHGGTKEQQQEFRKFMDESGLGNHPILVRLIANASRGMAEGKPLPATKPASQPQSKVAKRYGQTN